MAKWTTWGKLSLFFLGDLLGAGICAYLFTTQGDSSHCQASSSSTTLLAYIGPQETVPYAQTPQDVALYASKRLFTELPPQHAKSYLLDCSKNCHPTQRALRAMGWRKKDEMDVSRIVHTDYAAPYGHKELESWQRFNHIYNRTAFSSRDNFVYTMKQYQRKFSGKAYFFPETFRLHDPSDRQALKATLKATKRLEKQAWLLETGGNKQTETQVIPQHRASVLQEALSVKSKEQRSLQLDVCNPLYYRENERMMVRVFWMVASVDPLLVLYQDGFGRVGYNESNPRDMKVDYYTLDWASLEEHMWNHWKKSRTLRNTLSDPVVHVRNQFKEAIAMLVDAFRADTFKVHPDGKAEDGYEVFAADFMLDENLQIWMMDVLADTQYQKEYRPFMLEDNYYLLQKNHEVWLGMIMTLEEVWHKQTMGKSLLPLQRTGKWQLVVAGEEWSYSYKEFEPITKRPTSCKKRPKKSYKNAPQLRRSNDDDYQDTAAEE